MPETLFTKLRHSQYRGPTTSDDVNARIEENYKDLVALTNQVGISQVDIRRAYQRFLKDVFSLTKTVEDLEERIKILEFGSNKISFSSPSQIDNDRFIGTPFEIPNTLTNYYDFQHGLLTLPKIENSSLSKIRFTTTSGTDILPSTFEMIAQGDATTADNATALIDTSDPHNAILNDVGKIWERNVVVGSPNTNHSIVTTYVRFPLDLSVVENTNVVVVHPFPALGCDLLEVAYSTKPDIFLNDDDDYIPLNSNGLHPTTIPAIGWVPPGAWDLDEILNCGPKAFYCDPKPITALRLKLRQRNYFKEADKYVYSYGIANLDARYDKFLDTGKTIIKFTAPPGKTISSITGVTPEIWNVPTGEIPDVFSYRVIWEQGLNTGVYSTNPVGLSSQVWIEVTLNKTIHGGTPALNSLSIAFDDNNTTVIGGYQGGY